MSDTLNLNRRDLLGAAALSLLASQLPAVALANAGSALKSFASLKQIDAGVLNIGYVDAGHPRGKPVVLLHGWPYDIHAYFDVVPLLTAAGYRVIVPHLRGYGTTRFLSDATPRNGQQSALALDVI